MSNIPNNKRIAIIGGGTNTYISNHLALSAPAYGTTATELAKKFKIHSENKMDVQLILTKMASSGIDCAKVRNELKDCKNEILELSSIPDRNESQEKLLQSRYPYKARLESYLGSFEGLNPDTPAEVEALVDKLIADPDTRVIIFNVAMVDYKPINLVKERVGISNSIDDDDWIKVKDTFGKYEGRINTSENPDLILEMTIQDKIIQKIRKERKDILLVGFKTTCGASKEEQYNKGLKLCKDASANIVFVNDVDKNRIKKLEYLVQLSKNLEMSINMDSTVDEYLHRVLGSNQQLEYILNSIKDLQNNGLVTPEESSYWYSTRDEALDALVQMVLDRSHLHFTRSTVVDSETVPWNIRKPSSTVYTTPIVVEPKKREYIPNPIIPETFRTVFDWVRSQGAYKKGPTGATVGHFGIKLGPNEFLTSKRKTDFNNIEEVGLVRVITDDPDNVFGYKHFFETDEEKKLKELIQTYSTAFALGELGKEDRDNLEKTIMESQEKLLLISSKTNKSIQRIEKQLESIKDPVKLAEGKRFLNKAKEDYIKQLPQKENKVIAFGAKPSVGGQSQRSLFETYPDLDCIVHFHCPLKVSSRDLFNATSQFSFECGSHECIASNITGFKEYKVSDTHSIWAGHMIKHGPNIVFNKDIDPQLVIDFINTHWDLTRKTDGLSQENK